MQGLGELYAADYEKSVLGVKGPDKTKALEAECAALMAKGKAVFEWQRLEVTVSRHAVSYKLDALSNFHYTPRPPTVDLAVVPNVPAIAMEEVCDVSDNQGTLWLLNSRSLRYCIPCLFVQVLPMAVSDAQAQAPEEAHPKTEVCAEQCLFIRAFSPCALVFT